MNRLILGAFLALMLVGLGLFWWSGRAEVAEGAPPPEPAAEPTDPNALPSADPADMIGPAPPEATELTREQQRFFRYDRNRDLKITRAEMLSTRTKAFRDLDADGKSTNCFAITITNQRCAGMAHGGLLSLFLCFTKSC